MLSKISINNVTLRTNSVITPKMIDAIARYDRRSTVTNFDNVCNQMHRLIDALDDDNHPCAFDALDMLNVFLTSQNIAELVAELDANF